MARRLFILFLTIIPLYNVKPAPTFYSEAVFFTQDGDYFLHTVEQGQTVYSISRMYNVTADAIYALNPESREVIKVGTQLKIPQESGSFLFHTIQPKETLYSVSRKYQMKGEDIMSVNQGLTVETFSIGKVIRIPTNRVTTPMTGTNEESMQKATNALLQSSKEIEKIGNIRIALLLPFAGNAQIVEYFEGFLLALQDVKKQGINVSPLIVKEIGKGTDLLPSILNKLPNVDLIIGGFSDEQQIRMIANYCREKDIHYVIPFTSRNDETMAYQTVYQVNMPQSYMHFRAVTAFCNRYRDTNIVFHVPSSKQGNQIDFVRQLQRELKAKNISYHVLTNDVLSVTDVANLLDANKNTVFVPSDDGSDALSKLVTPLRNALNANPQMQVSLFGYTGWQASGANYLKDLARLNATFFSVFYVNTASPKYKTFHANFIRWYSKELLTTYPKYGLLGYDTGMFFINALNRYGSAFASHINQFKYSGIQMDFNFERVNNWGGFINNSFYFVDFLSDGNIVSNPVK